MEGPSTLPYTEHARMSTIKSSSPTSSSRCSQCNTRRNKNTRNLVVCIDGTSNQFGQNNTNVVKLFAKIDLETRHPEQFAYYSSGIGTRAKSLNIFQSVERKFADGFDMAIAWNMEEIVKDAYGWLTRTYQEGDQIYLFGFSRGAYQVRVLAGMIYEVGLIRTHTDKQIGNAYDHYEAIRSGKPKTRQIAREFKTTFSWKDAGVHFVGVWDTVSSVGLIRGDVFLSTSSSAAHACHFRHALALDELRVKFMPEYFHEMNSQTEIDEAKSKYTISSVEHAATPASERRESTVSDSGTRSSGEKKNVTTEIKEVWFAGSHSDVGGRNRPGQSYQAGNVSLLWMRREAAASGLVLQPTDIAWVPDDLDFGTSDSMTWPWKIVEQIPIKHQVSFSGSGNNDARRRHRLQPRRIIPGQKVHASILYANAYNPQATLGEGFDIPTIHGELEETELDSQIWEKGLFDDTAAEELVRYLSNQQGVAPVYLDRLLFMLRFNEGKQCVRNVPNWQTKFTTLIHGHDCAPLVRLVTIVAYYEASGDPGELSEEVFNDAKDCFSDILGAYKHRDGPRVVALLRPLAKHQILRERILTPDVLDTLVKLLDEILKQSAKKQSAKKQPGVHFGQAMDGLNCLLRCEDTQQIIIEKLAAHFPNSDRSRLFHILKIEEPRLLTAALRMVLTLTRIPGEAARSACSAVKPRLRELARYDERLVGLLAVEILIALYDPNDREQLNIRNSRIRANLAGALVRLNPNSQESAHEQGGGADVGQQVLRRVFGLGTTEPLSRQQKALLKELQKAVQGGDARERTAATMTLLKLCETEIIRTHLCEMKLLDVFVDQLQRKDSALLTAYALTVCLKYEDMKQSIDDNGLLPKHIVGMLRLDYFDDAVGRVEGFQIFGEFMQHADLREKIKAYDINEVLKTKLGKGKAREIRTSLICLNIFRSFEPNGTWTDILVKDSLECLRESEWKTQKAGVAILSALARTAHGVAAITPRIDQIIGMLLPDGYLPIPRTAHVAASASPSSPSGGQMQVAAAGPGGGDSQSPSPSGAPSRPPSWMLGPACALRVLAQNDELRRRTRETLQYASLKHLYLSGTLVDETDTSAWRIRTPNRADVMDMLDKMIKAVDEELWEEGLVSIEDAALPHIRHWDRLMTMVRNRTVAIVSILPGVLGVSTLAILAVVVLTPLFLSVQLYASLRRLFSFYQNIHALDHLILHGRHDAEAVQDEHEAETSPAVRQGEGGGGSNGYDDAGPSGEHGGESSQGVGIVHSPGGDAPGRGITIATD